MRARETAPAQRGQRRGAVLPCWVWEVLWSPADSSASGHELQETSPTHVSERSLLNYSKRILSASSRDSVQLNVDRILYKNVIYQFNAVINSAVFIAP